MRFFFIFYFITIGILLSTIVALPVRRPRRNLKVFDTPASFERLEQRPAGQRVYKCKDCEYRVADPTLKKLEAHERTHTKRKFFFALRYHFYLVTFLRTPPHTAFKCDKPGCNQAFAEQGRLDKHKESILLHRADPAAVAEAKKKVTWDVVNGTRRVTP